MCFIQAPDVWGSVVYWSVGVEDFLGNSEVFVISPRRREADSK